MRGHGRVLLVALLAAVAGAAASLYFEPSIAQRLAATDPGQRVLGALLAARSPSPPAGVRVAGRDDRVQPMTLVTVDGVPTQIPGAWAGRTTLVNLWASWCGPCLNEMPELQAHVDQQAANGVQVVGIALDDAASARAMLRRLRIAYPNLVDAPGPADAGVRLGNRAGVLPYSVLLSQDGRVLKTKIGPFANRQEIADWVGH